VRDASGQLLGYEGMVDTERKQVEEALAKRERYLAALVEAERKLLTLMVTETTLPRDRTAGKSLAQAALTCSRTTKMPRVVC